MKSLINSRLSGMMFLQYFIWGSWFVTAYPVLSLYGFGGNEIKWTYSAGPIAAILSPMFVGLIADRWFATQKVLASMHFLGGLAFLGAVIALQREVVDALQVNLFILLHMCCYMPTIALSNSLTLANVEDANQDFPRIRMFGGIGWIVAGIFISLLNVDTSIKSFYITIIASFIMAFYSLTLPNTTPKIDDNKKSFKEFFGLDAFKLFRQWEFVVFSVGMVILFIPTQFYFQLGSKYLEAQGHENIAMLMSLGQISELCFILLLPFFLKRFSLRAIIISGAVAWCARYCFFIFGYKFNIPAADIAAILLHGICYDFCFIAGMLYIDKVTSNKIRSQAQGLFMMMTYGLGMMLGAQIAGFTELNNSLQSGNALNVDWAAIWTTPLVITVAVVLLLLLFFHPKFHRKASD